MSEQAHEPTSGSDQDDVETVPVDGPKGLLVEYVLSPDVASVDAEGCYWVAAVYGWAVLRFTPEGVLDRTIELPVEAPTMPAFGGAELRTMFVTSIGAGASRSLSPSEVPPGSLLTIDAGVTGRIDVPFAG